jgi:hypothetical protein
MKQHEREYFTARVRSGVIKIQFKDFDIKVEPISIGQNLDVQEHFLKAYREAEEEGFLTSEDLLESLKKRGIWTEEDEEREKGLEKDIERLQIELFQNKNKSDMVKKIRLYLKAGKKQYEEILSKKGTFFENSCEGIAQHKKLEKILLLSCFKQQADGSYVLYDFEETPVDVVMRLYGAQVASEESIRDIARSEPWRSTWILKDSDCYNLFYSMKDKELTTDQRNLIIWSKMYDNVQESPDCPSDDVLEDDDMLDGWFALQRKKREQERATSDVEQSTRNSKISNSDEIFVMAHSKEDAEKINESNTFHAQKVKQQRAGVIKQKGSAVDLDFQDQQLKMRQQTNEAYKGKFRR